MVVGSTTACAMVHFLGCDVGAASDDILWPRTVDRRCYPSVQSISSGVMGLCTMKPRYCVHTERWLVDGSKFARRMGDASIKNASGTIIEFATTKVLTSTYRITTIKNGIVNKKL